MTSRVDLDEGARGRRLYEAEAEQRERRARSTRATNASAAGPLPRSGRRAGRGATRSEPLQQRDHEGDRDEQERRSRRRGATRFTYIAPGRRRGSGPRCGGGRGGAGRPASRSPARRRARRGRSARASSEQHRRPGCAASWTRPCEPFATPEQKRSVAPVPNDAAGRHGVAPVAPVLATTRSDASTGLQVRPGRAVEERLLRARPSAPRTRSTGTASSRRRVARDRLHDRPQLAVRAARVVAADARPRRELPR